MRQGYARAAPSVSRLGHRTADILRDTSGSVRIPGGGVGNANKRLYRVMSEQELRVVQETGLLRGGRQGTTYFTDSYYRSAANAQNRLALQTKPDYIMQFEIVNKPNISGGTRVQPGYGGLGGGREYFTNDSILVRIINYQNGKIGD